MRREVANSIPERKRVITFETENKHPLFAWIIGANKVAGKSPIECVLDNQTRWPWTTLSASGYVFMDRILSKKPTLTVIQKNWLRLFVESNFPGRYRDRVYRISDEISVPFNKKQKVAAANNNVSDFLDECLDKAKVNRNKIPLRLIFSDELSCLINIKFLEYYL